MDFLRSAYSTKVHFKAGDSRESTITWYKAPEGAEAFPEHHYFGSRNYADRTSTSNPVGEIGGIARPWSNGATPEGVVGTNFCGAASEYRGITAFRTTDIPLHPNGQPTCCDLPEVACVQFDTDSNFRYAHTVGGPDYLTAQGAFIPEDYVFFPAVGSPQGFWWIIGEGTCGGPSFSDSKLFSFDGDPFAGVQCTPLAFADASSPSSWSVPADAPYQPGTVFNLDAPHTPPPELLQHAGNNGASPRSVTWPAATTAGSLLVAVISYNSAAADPTLPSGWSLARRKSTGTNSVAIAYKEGAASQTVTGNFSGGTVIAIECAEYRNIVVTGSLDQIADNSGTSATASTGTTSSTVQPYELAIAALSANASAVTFSAPTNGFDITGQRNASGLTACQMWLATLATGTYAAAATLSASRAWRGIIATFKGA
jgi:hypothetical protein